MGYILGFNEVKESDKDIVGIKGFNLCILYKNYKVPYGFIITSRAYITFLEKTGIKDKLQKQVNRLNNTNIQDVANEMQKLIVETTIPEFISREILEKYEKIDEKKKGENPVSIRSSYISEIKHKDVNQLTFLNVKGKNNILMAIKVAWANQFTYKNIQAREQLKLGHDVKNAIIIQSMVYPEKSILAYNHDPGNNDSSKIFIKAMFGIGEGFLYPETPYDIYIVDKKEFKISEKIITRQPHSYGLNPKNGKIAKFIIGEKSKRQKLTDPEIIDIAKFVDKATKNCKTAQRLELGLIGEKLFVFQSKDLLEEIKEIIPIKNPIETIKNEVKVNVESFNKDDVIKKEDAPIEDTSSKKIIDEKLTLNNSNFDNIEKEELSEENSDCKDGKTLLEQAEEDINDEERAYDKDMEDAYIELEPEEDAELEKAIKKPSRMPEYCEDEKDSDEEEQNEDAEETDDSIFSNMTFGK